MPSDVIDFACWFYKNGRPHKPPKEMRIFRTDSASSTCIYRDGRYQVELYLIDHDAPVPRHQHPGVDAVELDQRHLRSLDIGDDAMFMEQIRQFALFKGEWHGAGIEAKAKDGGHYLTSCQYWHDDIPMNTISVRWLGQTVGPIHDALIQEYTPDAYVIPGYADVTRSKFDSDVL